MVNRFLMAAVGAAGFSLAACDVHSSTYLYDEHPRHPVVVEQQPVYGQPGYVYQEPAPIYVREAPPPPPVERIVAAPGPGYVWVPGYYDWHDRWVWRSGHYERPPHQNAVWVPPHTERHGDRVEFRVGVWR